MSRTKMMLLMMMLVIAGVSLLVPALTVGCTSRAPGRIELSSGRFDFGTIPNTKSVSQVFEIRNAGQGTLAITGISTSCGCTTAKVASRELAPGQATELTVSYDPQAHAGATGDFKRLVYIRSDDPENPEATLTVWVRVVEP